MIWKRIVKNRAQFPTTGTYRDWKPALAMEGERRCVYCCIHEAHFGGPRNYHVEHYRPQSKFAHLTNSYENLFYVCSICNSFKGDDWPCEPEEGCYVKAFYPDPSSVNYGDLLFHDSETGEVRSNSVTGRYLVERLFINRPQMVINRRVLELGRQLRDLVSELEQLNSSGDIPHELSRRAFTFMANSVAAFDSLYRSTPYGPDDVRR